MRQSSTQNFQVPADFQMPDPQNTVAVGPGASYDYAALAREQKRLERQQEVAKALMERGSQQPQGQMVGGYYVGPGLMGNVAGLANTLLGAYMTRKGDEKAADLYKSSTEGRSKILQALIGGDPTASQQAIASGDPELIKLVQDRQLSPKDLLGAGDKYTPESLAAFHRTNDPKSLVPRTKMEINEGIVYDPYAVKPNDVVAQTYKPGPPTSFGGETQVSEQTGKVDVIDKAPRTSVHVDAGLGRALNPEVSKMLNDSKTRAVSAQRSLDAANQIDKAIGSGALTGTFGTPAEYAARVADSLGLGGSMSQKLAASKQLVQNLGQLTLEGRQQMRGQGAITEAEGVLAEVAASGSRSLSPAELRMLANAARRVSQYYLTSHQDMVSGLRGMEGGAEYVPFFEVRSMEETAPEGGQQPLDLSTPEGRLSEARRRGLIK